PTVLALLDSETAALAAADPAARHREARDIFVRGALGPELPEFFTTEASARHLTGPVARHWTYGPHAWAAVTSGAEGPRAGAEG
ncbi:hypothetical protein ADL27_57000, partial [Streptomyces sp. NRRL F-6602]